MRNNYLTKSILSAITILLLLINSAFGQITQVAGSPQSATTTGTTLTITKPSGLAVNDVMIANIVQSDNDGNTLNDATRSGWTQIDGRDIGANGNDHWRGTILYRVAIAADVSAANFAFTLDGDAGEGSVGAIVAFRGVDVSGGFNEAGTANSGPFDVDPGILNLSGDVSTVTATSITTANNNAAVIMLGLLGNNREFNNSWQTATGPLTLTELYDLPNNTGLDNGIGAAWALKPVAGNTGSGSANLSGNARNGGILIALKPLAVTPTITGFTPSNGCTNTTSVVITGTNFTGATAVTFGGTNAASFTVNSSTQITATPATGTTGTINVTTPAGNVTSSGSFTINPLPAVVSVSGGGVFCSSATLTASNGSDGTIYFQGTTSGGTSTATPSSSQSISTSGTYYFRARSSAGCWGTQGSAIVSLNASPNITTHPAITTQSICQITPATALSVVATGTGLLYQWYSNTTASNSGGTPIALATAANYTPLTTTVGTLYYYCIVSGTCAPAATSNVSGAITVKSLPVAGAISGTNAVCVGGLITLTSNASGTGPFTYTWSSSNTGLATITNAGSLTGVSVGTPQINYTVTQANACFATSPNFAVSVTQPTAAAITGLTKVCIGNTINLTAAGAGTAPLTYTWASSNTAVATVSTTGVVSGVANGTTSITYTVTDGNGCSRTSAGFTVTVSKPTANAITGATAVCIGNTIPMTSNASGTATLTNTWASSNTAVATVSATGVVTGAAAGTTNITYTVTDGNACPTTSPARVITVNAKPVAGVISGPTAVCVAGTISLSATATGALPLTITFNSSNTSIATVNSSGVVTGVAIGTTNISYSITDANGCSATSATYAVAVTKPTAGPITHATGGTVVCEANTLSLSSNATGTGSLTYTWASSNNGNATVSNSGVVSGISAGAANITYTVTDGSGCQATSVPYGITVTAMPTVNVSATPTTICLGSPVKFSADAGYVAYTFRINGATVQNGPLSDFNTSTLSGGEVATVEVFANNCSSILTLPTVTVNPLPVPTLSANKTTICPGENISFTAGGGTNYSFKVNGSGVQSGASNTYNSTTLINGDVVTVDVTNSNNCSLTSAAIGITVNAAPTGTLTASTTTICAGENITFTATGGTSYQFKVNGSVAQAFSASNTFSSTTLTNLSVVTVDVTNALGCTVVYSPGVIITVNPLPTIIVSPASASICYGLGTTITASGATTYSWSPATGLSATSGNVVNANPTTTTTYTVTGTNANGCINSTNVTITVNPLPSIAVTPFSATICNGQSSLLTASGAATYSWSPATGLPTTVGTAVTANPTTTTTYNVIGTDALGCYNSASVTVTVNPLPTITATPASAVICNGLSTSLTASGATTYTWSPATGLSATTGATVIANPTSTTTHTITGTDANGCINTTTVTVTVNPLPTITVTPASATICNGLGTSLTANGAATYSWSPATGLSATTGATVTANPTSTTTYIVTGTAANGCINSTSVTVTVNPLPTITVTPASTAICIGSSTSLNASGATSYSWSPATGLSATTGATVTANPTSTTTYTVTGTNGNGCINTTTVTITVNPLPIISVLPVSTSICIGSSTLLTASGAISYNWSPATGLSATTGATVTANPTSTTTYTITGTDVNGCVNTSTAQVAVNPLPVITVTPASATICNGLSTSLTASGASTYSWSPATGLSATTGATVTANPTSTTTYTVAGTDANGCINAATVTITVNPLPAIAVTPASSSICIGAGTSLTASGAGTYSWSPATGLSATTGATVTANPGATTIYTVTGTAANGCINTTSVTVTVNPLPIITVTPAAASICIGSSTSLTASGASYYSWSPATGLSATTGATVTANPTSTTTYTITGTDVNGCNNTAAVTVTVNPLPTITVTPASATICNGLSTSLTASGAFTYNWSPAAGLSATTGATVTANPTSTTTYTAIGTDANGCINSTTVTVTVNALPTIAVTPASAAICIGNSTSLTASGASTYNWSPATGLSATTGATVVANPIATTTYTITGTDANGCINSTTVTVTVNPLPTIAVTPASATICTGSSTSLSASGATTYSWSPATGLSATIGANVTASPTSTITYTVIGTNANGCINNTSVTITVNPLPVISVTPASATICNGFSTTLTASGAVSYAWSPSIGLSGTSGATVTASPSSTTTYTVVGTDANGCINATTVTVTVNPAPVPTITGKNPICLGDVETYTTQSGQSNYTWNVIGGTVTPGTGGTGDHTIEVTWTSTGSKTINVNYSNAYGCTATTFSTFSNAPTTAPPTILSGPAIVCINSTGNVYTTESGKTDYNWVITGGSITSGAGTNGVTVTWNNSGTQSLSINYSIIGGCNAATPTLYPVTVNPATGVTSFTSGAIMVCQNAADETYTATAANSTSITYTLSPASAGVINAGNGVMNWDATFSGLATITATSTGLCGTTSTNRIVTVNPSTGATSFTAGASTVCQNASDETYTATAANSTSITYSVSPGSAGVINAGSGLMNWDAAFSGTATITATSTGLCGTTSSNRVVTVNPSTGATSFTSGATTVCQNASDETYTATADNSTSITYSVLPVTAGVINAGTGLMNWDAAFSGTATITATSTGLCGSTSANRVVTVSPSTGTTNFTTGATTICQNAADEQYTATALNNTSITYTVLPLTAGVINAASGIMNWDAVFSGTATITATSTGLCGTTTANRVVTVNPSTGVTNFTAGATIVCQNAADETYTAIAANSTSITYAVLPATAGVINAGNGLMNWDAGFSGTATITATSTGLCGTTIANRVVTVNPSTGATSFTAGATIVCQNAADETYTAAAANSTSITYSVSPAAAGVINSASGIMNWDAGFSGTANITATSTGLCGTTSDNRMVTVNPSTGSTNFTAGATTVCQNAADETYTATAANSTLITYSVSPASAGVINSSNGLMNWDASFSGAATITATSTGLCGTTSSNRIVTVNPTTGATGFTAGATTVCQNAADETYAASAANSTSIVYSVLPAAAGVINSTTGIMNWDAAFSGTATITAISTGLCGTSTNNRVVTVNPTTGATNFTVGATTVCQNAADETYTATAVNSTSIAYSVSPASAGVINSANGLMNWDASFSGTATITATSTGLCGTTSANRIVAVNPTTGATGFTAGATTVCQNAADETYSATAANSTSRVYSVLPAAAGIINATTGIMNWDAGFSGTATITATSTGLCGTSTADRIVTVNPTTGATSFTAGATTVCQNAADETYTAIAANATSITYTVSPGTAGVINAGNGIMNWDVAFSGTATITATSTGLCGTSSLNRVVTVNPSTGATNFTVGATTVCQNAADETYTATATNSTSRVYSVLPAAAGIINASTGVMNWDALFSGTATITATSTGLCGTTTANRVVTVNPATGTTSFTAGSTSVCQNAPDVTYTATAANSISIAYAVSPVAAGVININTGVMNWDATYIGAATITATATGLCGTTTATRLVTVNAPPSAPTITPSSVTICQNSIQPLSAGTLPVTSTVSFSSGTNNVSIPNNNSTGIANTIAVSGIPAGAVINSVNVNFNITHQRDDNLRINLKAPNNQILNLVDGEGGTGRNFTNTIITSILPNASIIGKSAPFTGTFAPEAGSGISAGSASGGNATTTAFASLFTTPNGNWVFGVRDANNNNSSNGTLVNWSITINYTISGTAQPVTWSPITDLYTDAGATTAYTGTSLATVYAKPATAGAKVYTATATNAAGCTNTSTTTLTVNPVPVVTILADYCLVPGRVRLTASSTPSAATYVWSTGATGSYTDVDIAEYYDVVATFATGCATTASINIAVELVTNGDFSAGNTGFFTEYTNNQAFYNGTVTSGLYPEGYYAVNTNAYSPSNGIGYHPNFHGKDHTTGNGNFLMINGSATLIGSPARLRTIWQQTLSVLPNTNYYFSAYGMNLNPSLPAQLQFEVNGVPVGTIADLNVAPKPSTEAEVGLANWVRFYSNPNWNSGSNTTAVIRIINLNTNAGGNDFGLDDISFSTLSPFITLISAPGTDGQTVCVNSPISTILYSIGSGSEGPTVTGLPPGVTSSFNGVNITITGTPTVAGSYAYNITSVGNCNPVTATGTITVQAQIINLTSGSSVQTSCKNAAIAPVVYTVSGTATNASITGLPAGVSMAKAGNVFTISGTPSVAGVFNYSITTSGTCPPVTVSGSITIQEQTITHVSGSTAQSLCINNAIANIVYSVGGTATGASIGGSLPTGVTGSFNSGFFIINGTPTQSGTFNYTVTTSGNCVAATAQLSGTITVNPNATGGTLPSVSICVGSSGALTLTGHSGTIQNWESSTNGGASWSPIVNNTVSQPYSNVTVPTLYRVKVSNGCNTTYSNTATLGIHNLWTGGVSSNWNTGANWSDGLTASNTCPDVIIPAGTPYAPTLGSGTATINNIIIYPTATLTVTGATLQLSGSITAANGSIDARNGTLDFNGTSGQQVAGNMLVDNTLKNLTISNGTIAGLIVSNTPGNLFNITGTIAFGNVNNATLNTGDNVVLISNATATARVADITNSGSNAGNKFNGNVTVERYFPARRAWRLLTSPLNGTGSIFNTWQAGGNYNVGKGMFVTAPTVANGIDESYFKNYSMYTFNSAANSWVGVSNTQAQLLSPNSNTANIGYFTFVRGDRRRSPDNTNVVNVNTTTLSSIGKLQTGIQTFTINPNAGGIHFIGNPYASSVDFNLVQKASTNLLPKFYVHDPNIGDVGGFVLLEDGDGDGNYLPPAMPVSSQRNFIQSSQAIFVAVNNTANGATVVFNEHDKSNNATAGMFRPATPSGLRPALRIGLSQLNAGNSTLMMDGCLVEYDDTFNEKVDNQDALKFTNVTENLSFLRYNKYLTVERRPIIKANDTLFLQLTRTKQRSYRLEFFPANLDPLLTAFLEDGFTGISTPLNLALASKQDFEITADSKSSVINRFRIVFKQTAVLPVTFRSVKAYQQAANIAVDWSVENEINISRYEVEKSVDGLSFAKVNSTAASTTNRTSATYSWLDVNPLDGNNFYRVKSVGADGKFEYSRVVVVKMGKVGSGIRIYPNPVTAGIIGVEFKNMDAGIYSVRLFNNLGQLILSKTINHARGTSMENIQPDYKLISGIYQLEVTAPDKVITTVKVIVK